MANLYKTTIPKYVDNKKGYNTSNDAYYMYGRYGVVIYYDSIFNTVDVQWLDNNASSVNLPVNFVFSSAGSSSGYCPKIGDVLYFKTARQNYGSGSYQAVGLLSSSTEALRYGSFSWNTMAREYTYAGHRISESGEIYERSELGSDLYLSDTFELNSGLVRIEGNGSRGGQSFSGKNFNFYGAGIWHSLGMNTVPYAYFSTTGGEYTLQFLAPNHVDTSVSSKSFDSDIFPSIASDGGFVYNATESDNEIPAASGGLVFPESDWLVSDFVEAQPSAVSSNDYLTDELLKVHDSEKGHIVRHGFGTKIGKDPDKKYNYARPMERVVFEDEGSIVPEDVPENSEPGILSRLRNALSIAFWVNIFRDGFERAFFEIDKSGSLKFLFNGEKLDSDNDVRVSDAAEGVLNGRLKLHIFGHHPKNSTSYTQPTGPFPDFSQNQKPGVEGDSVYLRTESGINVNVAGPDTGGSGLFLNIEGASMNVNVEGQLQREVGEEELTLTWGRTYNSYGEKKIENISDTSTSFSLDRGIQSEDTNFAIGSGKSLRIGFGSTINELTGEITGGRVITVTESGGTLTIDWGGMTVYSQNANLVTFASNVNVGTGNLKPVGLLGSISSFSGSTDDHSNHRLAGDLSTTLMASS